MTLTLDHYSIRSADLDASRRFYTEVLGLQVGPRPEFAFPGLWLYKGDTAVWANAVVHIIGTAPAPASDSPGDGLKDYLGARDDAAMKGTGVLDHVAFFATGLAAMRAKLQRLGLVVRERTVPGLGLHQVFLNDPNGVVIEINYPAAEA